MHGKCLLCEIRDKKCYGNAHTLYVAAAAAIVQQCTSMLRLTTKWNCALRSLLIYSYFYCFLNLKSSDFRCLSITATKADCVIISLLLLQSINTFHVVAEWNIEFVAYFGAELSTRRRKHFHLTLLLKSYGIIICETPSFSSALFTVSRKTRCWIIDIIRKWVIIKYAWNELL